MAIFSDMLAMKHPVLKKIKLEFFLFFILACFPRTLLAGGYAIEEQSAEGNAVSYAGSVAGYSDGSSAAINPAAMSHHKKTVMSASAQLIKPSIEYRDKSGEKTKSEEDALVPNFYMVHPLDDFSLGFFLNSPFGLSTDYGDKWNGRYESTKSSLEVLSFGPAVSYAVTNWLSVGFNVSAIHSSAELGNSIDFGAIGESVLGPDQDLLKPGEDDGRVKIKGEDWALGWSSGIAVNYAENSRAGLVWRGKSTLHYHGEDATFDVPDDAQILTSDGAFTNTGARADLTLPESLAFGISHQYNDRLRLLYESQWMRWSRFEDVRVRFDNPSQPDAVSIFNLNPVWRHSVGAMYDLNEDWQLRFGFLWEQSSVSSSEYRRPSLPDSRHYWLSTGFSYRINPKQSVAVSYAHVFFKDSSTVLTGETGQDLNGNFEVNSETLSLSYTYNFT